MQSSRSIAYMQANITKWVPISSQKTRRGEKKVGRKRDDIKVTFKELSWIGLRKATEQLDHCDQKTKQPKKKQKKQKRKIE